MSAAVLKKAMKLATVVLCNTPAAFRGGGTGGFKPAYFLFAVIYGTASA
jgi:hypothetical protein